MLDLSAVPSDDAKAIMGVGLLFGMLTLLGLLISFVANAISQRNFFEAAVMGGLLVMLTLFLVALLIG